MIGMIDPGEFRGDTMEVVFRTVEPCDYGSTREVVDAAFRPEDVVTFLDALRADGCILGEWIAEDSSGPIGLIVFSRVSVAQRNGKRFDGSADSCLGGAPGQNRIGHAANVEAFPCLDRGEVAESDVERVNQYPLYELGKALRAV